MATKSRGGGTLSLSKARGGQREAGVEVTDEFDKQESASGEEEPARERREAKEEHPAVKGKGKSKGAPQKAQPKARTKAAEHGEDGEEDGADGEEKTATKGRTPGKVRPVLNHFRLCSFMFTVRLGCLYERGHLL